MTMTQAEKSIHQFHYYLFSLTSIIDFFAGGYEIIDYSETIK